jgi:hypothetical protein
MPRSLILLALTLLLIPVPTRAADSSTGVTKTIRVPGHNDLMLNVPEGWDLSVQYEGGGPPQVFVRKLGSKDTGLSITVQAFAKGGKITPNERARASVENRAKALLPQLKETTLEYKEIKGKEATGYYCLITHKKAPKGQGPHGTLAAVAVGDDLLLTCDIAQKFETGPWQKLALDILRTATQKPVSAATAPAATRPAAAPAK